MASGRIEVDTFPVAPRLASRVKEGPNLLELRNLRSELPARGQFSEVDPFGE